MGGDSRKRKSAKKLHSLYMQNHRGAPAAPAAVGILGASRLDSLPQFRIHGGQLAAPLPGSPACNCLLNPHRLEKAGPKASSFVGWFIQLGGMLVHYAADFERVSQSHRLRLDEFIMIVFETGAISPVFMEVPLALISGI